MSNTIIFKLLIMSNLKHTTKEENQADTLANALIDIEESIQKIKEQIPQLYLKDLTKDEVEKYLSEM